MKRFGFWLIVFAMVCFLTGMVSAVILAFMVDVWTGLFALAVACVFFAIGATVQS